MALPAAGVVGGRDGGQPVTGGARGSARAAARRVPQVQRRSCQLGDARVPRARRARPAECARPSPCPPGRATHTDNVPSARRAPRP